MPKLELARREHEQYWLFDADGATIRLRAKKCTLRRPTGIYYLVALQGRLMVKIFKLTLEADGEAPREMLINVPRATRIRSEPSEPVPASVMDKVRTLSKMPA